MNKFVEILNDLDKSLSFYRNRLNEYDQDCINSDDGDYNQDDVYEIKYRIEHLQDGICNIKINYPEIKEEPKIFDYENIVYPPYVCFKEDGRCALAYAGDGLYYRDAGHWEVHVHVVDGKILINELENHPHLHDKELIETTRDQWAKDNEGYI
jgi:hypothetical protein